MKIEGNQPKRGRGRPRTRNLDREVMLEQAMRLFWEQGYETTSTRELAAKLSATQAELYGMFGDKEGLFKAAVQHYQQGAGSYARAVFDQEDTARAAVERMLLEAARNMVDPKQPPGCMLVTSAMNCANTGIQQLVAEQRANGNALLQARIERGIREGDVPSAADAAAMASFYTTVLQGLTIQARDGASAQLLTAIVEQAMQAWPD